MLWGEVLRPGKILKLSKNNFILGMWFADIQAEIYEDFVWILHRIDTNYFIVVINYKLAVEASFGKRGISTISKALFARARLCF